MSKLGEWLGYTGDECPNCGRVRVKAWTCGKHICEKCHWCIEDQAYYYEDWDEEEEPINWFGLKNAVDKEEVNDRLYTLYGVPKTLIDRQQPKGVLGSINGWNGVAIEPEYYIDSDEKIHITGFSLVKKEETDETV